MGLLALIACFTILASTATIDASDCSEKRATIYTELPPPLNTSARNSTSVSGLQRMFIKLHGSFGFILVSTDIPEGIKEEGRIERDLLWRLLLQSPGVVVLGIFTFVFAGAVPLIGVVVLWKRCSQPPEKNEEMVTSTEDGIRKTMFALWILIVCLAMMSAGALVTVRHAPVALDAAKDHERYLANNLPAVLEKSSHDLAVIAGTNINEFSNAIDRRTKDCSEEAASTVDSVVSKSALLNFVATTAKRLMEIDRLIRAVDEAANHPDLGLVWASIHNASVCIDDAMKVCTGQCDAQTMGEIQKQLHGLDQFAQGTEIKLPHGVKQLMDKLKNTNMSAVLALIPSSEKASENINRSTEGLRTELQVFAGHIDKIIRQLDALAKRSLNVTKNLVSLLENVTGDVAPSPGVYQGFVTAVAGITAIIVGLYALGNQCLMLRAPTGVCSFSTASRVMLVAVFVFVVFFPLSMITSTLGTSIGMVADQKLCVPAQSLGAPGSHSFIEFLANSLGSKGAGHTSAALHEEGTASEEAMENEDDTENEEDAEMEDGTERKDGMESEQAAASEESAGGEESSLQRGDGGYSISRHQEENHGSSSWERVCGTATEHITEQQKCAPHAMRKKAGCFVHSSPHSPDPLHFHEDIGASEPDENLSSKLSKVFSPTSLLAIFEQFGKCSNEGLSFFELFGTDIMRNITVTVLSEKSPWLGLVDDGVGAPRFSGLQKLGEEPAPNIDDEVKGKLGAFALPILKGGLFKELADKAEASIKNISVIHHIRRKIEELLSYSTSSQPDLQRTGTAVRSVLKRKDSFIGLLSGISQRAQELDEAFDVNGKSFYEVIKENVHAWEKMRLDLGESMKTIRDVGLGAETGFAYDVEDFFNHVKAEVRTRVGDCRALYALYRSTVSTVCDQGVRPLATFWCGILWYLILGVPSAVMGYALATQFAAAAAERRLSRKEYSTEGKSTTSEISSSSASSTG
ncbi:uncharacterized protein [Dermacentor andersoni]|uniref:uncharacterized protein isoform X1 n=1 Tax=Dermacentor andersoni TaxID=34620 RepID=UPI003B3B62A8